MTIGIAPDPARGFSLVDNSWLNGVVTGQNPITALLNSGTTTQFGSGTSTFPDEGNINRQISAAGVNPGATGADNVLAVFTLPANSFDVAGRGINIMACGQLSNAATAKTIKIIFNATTAVVGSTVSGGTTIGSFTDSTANSAGGWQVSANVFKYGAAGSNTQLALHEASQSGTVVGGLVAPSTLTATESGAIIIAITGNATTATTDIKFSFLEINAMN